MQSYVNFQDAYSYREFIRMSAAHRLVNTAIYVHFYIYVIQQDTKYLMINFILNIQ